MNPAALRSYQRCLVPLLGEVKGLKVSGAHMCDSGVNIDALTELRGRLGLIIIKGASGAKK